MTTWLSELDIKKLAEKMAKNAYGGEESDLLIYKTDKTPILRLYGHTYEPHYEEIDSICAIYGYKDDNEITLFDKDDYSVGEGCNKVRQTGSMDNVMKYIKENDCEVVIDF